MSKFMSVAKVWKKLGRPEAKQSCSPKHISEITRHLKRWRAFWETTEEPEPAINEIRRLHLEQWRRSLIARGDFSERTINKHLGTIRKMLIIATNHEIIASRPQLEQLPEISAKCKPKLYLDDSQLDRLMDAADALRWPRVGVPPADFWRCALILYRYYGFRTQELLAYEALKCPITWANVTFETDSPDIASNRTNDLGWLAYVPPKTAKLKPTPIVLPLTRHTRHALNVMMHAKSDPARPVFPNPRNQSRFFETWYSWMEIAEVRPKDTSLHYIPYCMRKTAATHHNAHKPGLASAVCRWGKTTDSNEASVASEHYISTELMLDELHRVPMPESFDRYCAA